MTTTVPHPTAVTTAVPKAGAVAAGGGRTDSPLKRALIHASLFIAALIAIVPVMRVVSVSLRPGDRLLSRELEVIPEGATLASYGHVLFETDFLQWMFNSLIITVGTSLVGLTALLATQLIPATMLLVPILILAIQLDLVGTYRGLVIAYAVTSVPFSIWILKGYYDTVPIELEEAARIDGCSQLEAFVRVLLPLSTPALAIVFLFNFLAAWNEYVLARILIGSTTELFTWPLGILRFQNQFQTQWGDLAASSVLVSIPVVALFLYSSKWLISGVTLGGVKG